MWKTLISHWSLCDSKSPQVSRTLLSILAVLNNVIVWMVSTRPLTSESSSPFSTPFVTVPNAPITIGIIGNYHSLIRAFHISVTRWFFTGVWVTASLLKSPGLLPVFWPFSIMLSFGWFLPVRQLPSPLVPLVIL